MTMADRGQRVALLALLRVKGVHWHFVAREAQRPDGLERLLSGKASEGSAEATESLQLLAAEAGSHEARRAEIEEMLEATESAGARLTTVVDDDYPVNLRTIFNLPPFLFYRGELRDDDARAVAVVGTRQPTPDGLRRASEIAKLLAQHHVTVLSGLARGIDTAAHTACLEAKGRTIAVLGSGINQVYPRENEQLATAISTQGTVVSQFWPNSSPAKFTFPRRNVVMSGMGQGTVVIEASETSGAKMQARYALQHGKRVWLLRSLYDEYEWARMYADERGANVVETVEEIVGDLRSLESVKERADMRMQLTLAV
jgi:DNA processing protein